MPPSCTLLQVSSSQWCQRCLLFTSMSMSEQVIPYLLVEEVLVYPQETIILCDSQTVICRQSLTTAPYVMVTEFHMHLTLE